MNEKYTTIIKFLNQLGIDSISDKEKNLIIERINRGDSIEVIKKELELLFALNKVLIKSYSKVSISNMYKIDKDIDNELFIKLFTIFFSIKKKELSQIDTLKAFKKLTQDILVRTEKVNRLISREVQDSFDKVSAIKNSLYLSMGDKEKADKLFANCIKRSKLFVSECEIENLESLINCLKNNFSFSDDELVKISSRCATFFAFSSANKLDNLYKTINDFKTFISEGIINDNKATQISRLLDKSFKDIIINSSTIATVSSEAINKTVRFLMGEKLGILSDNVSDEVINLRGNFTPRQLAKIYNESVSALSISVEKVGDFVSNVNKVFRSCYGESIDINKIINGRNFTSLDQLTKEDYSSTGKIKNIFTLLKPFLSKEEMEKLLQNNFSFLIASESEVKTALKKAILTSKNNDELKANILQKIRNHFDRYEGLYKVQGDSKVEKISFEGSKKTSLNNVDEETLLKILKDLDSSENEISDWQGGWNKDDKEIRDLQVQLDLEEVLRKVKGLRSMGNIVYRDLEQFSEEALVFRDLLEEIVDEYQLITGGVKLNKELKQIAAQVEKELDVTIAVVNNHFEGIIKEYQKRIQEITKEVEKVAKGKDQYDKSVKNLIKLDEEIASKGISVEKTTEEIERYGKIFDLIEESIRVHRQIGKDEQLAHDLSNQFFHNLSVKREANELDNDRGIYRYTSPSYMYRLFAYIMIKEDLVYADERIHTDNIDEDDREMTFEQFRILLDRQERDLVDRVRALYQKNMEAKIVTYEALIDKILEFGEPAEDISTIKMAISTLDKIAKKFHIESKSKLDLLTMRTTLQKNISKIDIEGIESNLQKLSDEIGEYNQRIKKFDSMKISR